MKAVGNLSQAGNKALSFKSVTSYVLGDLDISKGEASSDLASFEISSNSSSINSDDHEDLEFVKTKDKGQKNIAKRASKKARKDEVDDELGKGYLANEAFKGFLADKSPISFKNPIFFSCPNSKFTFQRKFNPQEM